MTSVPVLSDPDPARSGLRELQRRIQLDEALLLEPATPGSWRVCDGRIPTGDGRFLGFIDERDGAFEVMQFADDFVWSTFPTMRAALDYIVATSTAVQLGRPNGELAGLL
jgi:hypothetical protein